MSLMTVCIWNEYNGIVDVILPYTHLQLILPCTSQELVKLFPASFLLLPIVSDAHPTDRTPIALCDCPLNPLVVALPPSMILEVCAAERHNMFGSKKKRHENDKSTHIKSVVYKACLPNQKNNQPYSFSQQIFQLLQHAKQKNQLQYRFTLPLWEQWTCILYREL